ncbi:MAG: DUF2721 domain-containing protein [Proteobacteria bacterium]|nr:DUF2721 domain-containing protein [Pseudomonadota bacterium]HQR04915.1 DUF2721 domain-containing protein [Rhodocyclaceae bacterium]
MVQIADITHTIQLAVAPVFLLTAIATLINVTNQRLGRIVDRRRVLYGRHSGLDDLGEDADELSSLHHRSHLIYGSMLCEVLSGLLVCLVVSCAFVGAIVEIEMVRTVALLFIFALLAMIVGLSLFLREVYLAVQSQGHRRP